jgi:transcriptional regulator with XRE-family HTH domain
MSQMLRPPTLGDLIRHERRKRNISGVTAARQLGITQSMLYMIEGGKRSVSRPLALEIGKWLGIGELAGAVLAGFLPWEITVEQAQKIVAMFETEVAA